MNYKMVIYTTGKIIGIEAICLLLSAAVSLIYWEISGIWLLLSAGIAAGLFLVSHFFKPKDEIFFAKEGLVTVALSWVILSVIGALPFFFSGEIPGFINCLFEAVSGLTTTGASIVKDVEALSHGILFWRSLTHWIGGMGVLVLVMAVTPLTSGRSIHMMRAEMPGPVVGKLVPKAKTTARLLYIIYIVLTVVLILLLIAGGMPIFESVLHAFGTAGTGGFGVKGDSIASYSPFLQWVITIFMILFGINFNLFYFVLIGKVSAMLKSGELWCYLGIILASTVTVTLNTLTLYPSGGEAIRHSAFQVASIISTTGYATTNFNAWPTLSKTILLCLMFLGGCAGSTAGGLKVSRLVVLGKAVRNRIAQILHPRTVKTVRFEGKTVDSETLNGVLSYFAIYMMCFVALFIILAFEPFDIESNFSAAAATFNNVGPGFGAAAVNYEAYSPLSKIAMSLAMLLGRLEIYPLLILFMPATWTRK
ncbi:MAG: TrkH family potassium uptake protein [Oscillospiraceae bacterium]|nr:TrkH family potassium uptake protein [Oscillospiraceae bacterium]